MLLLLFGPAFLMYTSEMYKDGIVTFLVVAAIGNALRLSRKLSIIHAAFGIGCLFALWQVRFYLVFVTLGPLVVGLVGLNSRAKVRTTVVAAVMLAGVIALAAYTDMLDTVTSTFEDTFQYGTNQNSLVSNASGGSGVTFDDEGDSRGAIGPKLLYMLFAPFPWQGGSMGFQIGKLDALLWYFLAYHAFLAARRLAREQPSLLLMFLVFLVPTTSCTQRACPTLDSPYGSEFQSSS